MKPGELFTIILKVIGIFLIKDVLISIPPVLYNVLSFVNNDREMVVFSLITSILTFGIYLGIVYLLLFQTRYLIRKLNLAGHLKDEPFMFNLHRSAVLTIAIIVSGIVILAFALPNLVQEIYSWTVFLDLKKEAYGEMEFNYSRMIISAAEIFIGLLFLGNQKLIVNFIESNRRKSVVEVKE